MIGLLLGATLGGLAAGAVHATTGPDHLAVVAPLAARDARGGWRIGARWGLGHALGVALVAAAVLAFRGLLPVEALESWSERLVGGSLVLVGLWVLLSALGVRGHDHGPGGEGRAALAVGTLHGTAGGSHLVGILPALALSSTLAAGAYLLSFAAGTVGAMTIFSWLVSAGGKRSGRIGPGVRTAFVGSCGVASIAVGLAWLAV